MLHHKILVSSINKSRINKVFLIHYRDTTDDILVTLMTYLNLFYPSIFAIELNMIQVHFYYFNVNTLSGNLKKWPNTFK